MRVKFYCPKRNEWTEDWVKVAVLPSSEQARKVHKNEVHRCWILVDCEIGGEDAGIGLTI